VGSIGLVFLSLGMVLWMREDHFQPTSNAERETWTAMKTVFLEGVGEIRGRPVLVSMLAITMVFGMFSEGIDRLFTPYLIDGYAFPALGEFDSVVWWGIIAAIASLFGLAATTVARRYVDLRDQLRLTHILSLCLLGVSASVLTLANVEGFYLVLGCYWLMGALRSAYGPLMTAWLNRLLPEASRATLFSMYGQADAVGQSFGGPVVGVLARTLTIGFAPLR
jgi:DHA3 family tetracycline resistance protein-like MFS transporter